MYSEANGGLNSGSISGFVSDVNWNRSLDFEIVAEWSRRDWTVGGKERVLLYISWGRDWGWWKMWVDRVIWSVEYTVQTITVSSLNSNFCCLWWSNPICNQVCECKAKSSTWGESSTLGKAGTFQVFSRGLTIFSVTSLAIVPPLAKEVKEEKYLMCQFHLCILRQCRIKWYP